MWLKLILKDVVFPCFFLQLCITTWKLLETALCKPHWHVVHNLVLRNLLAYNFVDLQSSSVESESFGLYDHSRIALTCQMGVNNQESKPAFAALSGQPVIPAGSAACTTSEDVRNSDCFDSTSTVADAVSQSVVHANVNNNSTTEESFEADRSSDDHFCLVNNAQCSEYVARETAAVVARSALPACEQTMWSGSPGFLTEENQAALPVTNTNVDCAVRVDTCADVMDVNGLSSIEVGCEVSVQHIVNLLVSTTLICLTILTVIASGLLKLGHKIVKFRSMVTTQC
jgi:hypothetical protein